MVTTSKLPIGLKQLDEIAYSPSSACADDEVLDLVEHVATLPGGLSAVVKRYALATNVALPRAVSFVLAQRAGRPKTESATSTLEFAARARKLEDASTLINVLTALQRHLMFDRLAAPDRASARVLFEFLMHCLEQPALVPIAASGVVDRIEDDGLVPSLFDADQMASLRRTARALSIVGDS